MNELPMLAFDWSTAIVNQQPIITRCMTTMANMVVAVVLAVVVMVVAVAVATVVAVMQMS